MTAPLDGRKFVLVKGGRLTSKAGEVIAVEGETCERVPASALPWLIEQGYLAPVNSRIPGFTERVKSSTPPAEEA